MIYGYAEALQGGRAEAGTDLRRKNEDSGKAAGAMLLLPWEGHAQAVLRSAGRRVLCSPLIRDLPASGEVISGLRLRSSRRARSHGEDRAVHVAVSVTLCSPASMAHSSKNVC